jgi:hypothetical protein
MQFINQAFVDVQSFVVKKSELGFIAKLGNDIGISNSEKHGLAFFKP